MSIGVLDSEAYQSTPWSEYLIVFSFFKKALTSSEMDQGISNSQQDGRRGKELMIGNWDVSQHLSLTNGMTS